jgi:predicted nucleotidyltransferase component of viral defense system
VKALALQVTENSKEQKLNTLREYLQNYILFSMQKVGLSESLYFVGGTALRFLYRLRRYSEDLDFSAAPGWDPSRFSLYMKKIESHLEKAGYSGSVNLKSEGTVQKAKIKLSDLLYECGLSHRKEQNLSIHLEIDLNPPADWQGEKTIVDIHIPVVLQHYKLASLYAGKLHAVLMRPYTKGRDIYDLFWYRSKHKTLMPNFKMLNNAVAQTTKNSPQITEENWLTILGEAAERLDWSSVENDVAPFLEHRDELITFTRENLLMLLKI